MAGWYFSHVLVCYHQSHNNLEKENNNSNFKNYNNNVLLKKLFAMSPANQINNNNIIIQNNNININNNFNIRKKVPFVLNFNQIAYILWKLS